MVYEPIPAMAGSKVPFTASVIPVPLQVPPPVAATKLVGVALTHKEAIGVIVASSLGRTVTIVVSTFPQAPEMV